MCQYKNTLTLLLLTCTNNNGRLQPSVQGAISHWQKFGDVGKARKKNVIKEWDGTGVRVPKKE
jgi:hypothetical protein